MKKTLCVLLMAAMLPLGGIPAADYTSDPAALPPYVTPFPGSETPNPQLASAIREYFSLSPSEAAQNTYSYFHLNVDNDRYPEILVLVEGPSVSGTGGSTLLIMDPVNHYKVLQKLTLVRPPIIATRGQHGYDLIVYRSGGGAIPGWVRLRNHGGTFDTVNDGVPVPSLRYTGGIAYLDDDYIGKGFTSRIPLAE
jgi:hypothetical protein